MNKAQEELTQLRIEYELLIKKFQELSEEKLNTVTGGLEQVSFFWCVIPICRQQ